MSRTLRRNSNGTTGNDYRTTVKKFNNTSYYLNSLEFETSIYKDALDPNSPDANLYSRIRNEYKVYELDRSNGNNRILSSSGNLVALPLPFDIGESESRKQAIVLLKKTNTIVKELSTDFIENEIQFSYDIYGRVIKYDDLGDLQNGQDNYYTEIGYHVLYNNILNVPKALKAFEGSTLKRHRTTEVLNSNTGNITKIKAWINGSDFSKTNIPYDSYGNLKKIIYPPNASGQSMFYEYSYGSTLNKYMVGINDAFGYESKTVYNFNFDVVLSTTDLASNVMKYSYDSFGRMNTIVAPKEANNTN